MVNFISYFDYEEVDGKGKETNKELFRIKC